MLLNLSKHIPFLSKTDEEEECSDCGSLLGKALKTATTVKDLLLWPLVGRKIGINALNTEEKSFVTPSIEEMEKDRCYIGCNYIDRPLWKLIIGVPLIYAPLVTTIPFMVPCIILVKTHLKLVGGMNIKSYWDFVPDWATHRYNYNSQIVLSKTQSPLLAAITKTKLFWLFNCKLYCPLSVATFSYAAYLVKIVENWWCPFDHERKELYKDGAIDYSFWHISHERGLLDTEDLNNPIWNCEIPNK